MAHPGRAVPSSSGKRNTILIATLTERRFTITTSRSQVSALAFGGLWKFRGKSYPASPTASLSSQIETRGRGGSGAHLAHQHKSYSKRALSRRRRQRHSLLPRGRPAPPLPAHSHSAPEAARRAKLAATTPYPPANPRSPACADGQRLITSLVSASSYSMSPVSSSASSLISCSAYSCSCSCSSSPPFAAFREPASRHLKPPAVLCSPRRIAYPTAPI